MKTIGVIGKPVLNNREKAALRYLGRAMARMGHRVALVPAKGTAETLREGVKEEAGEVLELERGVIETSDATFVYADKRLLSRLTTAYPDLQERADVVVIPEDQLDAWVRGATETMQEKGIELPR